MMQIGRCNTFGKNTMETYFGKEWVIAWAKHVLHTPRMFSNSMKHSQSVTIKFKGCGCGSFFCWCNDRDTWIVGQWNYFTTQTECYDIRPSMEAFEIFQKSNDSAIFSALLNKYDHYSYEIQCKTGEITLTISIWCMLKIHVFDLTEGDRCVYAEHCSRKISIVYMHEQQCEWVANNNIERYFADNYLLSLILQY